MNIHLSDIVISKNGRDAGKPFFVIGTDDEYLLLADGKSRRLENPKKKKTKHVDFFSESMSDAARRLRDGEKVTNSELRRVLKQIAEAPVGEAGGM